MRFKDIGIDFDGHAVTMEATGTLDIDLPEDVMKTVLELLDRRGGMIVQLRRRQGRLMVNWVPEPEATK